MPSAVPTNSVTRAKLPVSAQTGPGRASLLATTAVALAITFLGMEGAMAQVVWDGDTDTDWLTGSNWAGDNLPGVPEDVVINDGGLANQPVLAAGDTDRVRSVAVSDGSLTVDGTLRADNGTTVSGTGSVTVGGTGLLNSPTTNSGGTLTVDAGGRVVSPGDGGK